jgi:uncharacterized membrane protein YeiH
VLMQGAGMTEMLSAGVGFFVAVGIRGSALAFGWTLPTYRSRPGRDPEAPG